MPNWSSNPQDLNTDSELQRLLNLRWGAEPTLWPRLASSGLWDCVPVAQISPSGRRWWQRRQVLVIRVLPGRALESNPLALANPEYGDSSLIADNRAELLPSYLFERLYNDASELSGLLQERPTSEWEELAAAWGCDPERLPVIHASLTDDDLMDVLAGKAEDDDRLDHYTMLQRWLDGHPRKALVRYLQSRHEFLPWEPPDLEGAKSWREPLLLFSTQQIGGLVPQPYREQALPDALRVPMPHEANYQTSAISTGASNGTAWRSYSLHLTAATAVKQALEAGSFADLLPTPQGALIRAAVAFAEAGPTAYTGQAHLDAAEALAEAGDWEGSLSALLTAVSWQRARFGAPLRSSLHAWIQGTAEAGPDYQVHHELAKSYLEIVESAERSGGRPLLR